MAIMVKQNDISIENKLINLMLFNEDVVDTIIQSKFSVDILCYPLNLEIFNGIIDVYSDSEYGGIIIGSETNILFDIIKSNDKEKDKELLSHLNKIKNVKADIKHLSYYMTQLTNYFKIRNIIGATRNISNYLKENDDIDANELIDIYNTSYQEIYNNINDGVNSLSTTEALKQTVKSIIDESTNENKVKFNLSGIDDYAKFEEGYLSYIVGDTGLGKTTLSSNLLTACCANGLKVLYINLETKTTDYIKKIISAICNVDGKRIKYQRLVNPELLDENDWGILEKILEDDMLSKLGVYWIHDTQMTVEELKQQIVRHVRMYDIDVVIGDYYQLLTKEGYEDSPESVFIPKVSKELMSMAGEKYMRKDGTYKLLTHVWLAQSTKEIIYRQDKRPRKEDIYFGGHRDARLVLGIYRDEYYYDDTKKPNVFEIGILKQNNGIANEWFDFMFEPNYQTIRDMTDEEKEILSEYEEDYSNE